MSHPAFEACHKIIQARLYESPDYPIACRIHDAFGSLMAGHHNCLGCNFADITNGISQSLKKILAAPSVLEHDYADYILWLYLFVERANVVFDIVGLPDSYRHRHFDQFITIKRWANFFKHPNYFMLVHHATYLLDQHTKYDAAAFSLIIDTIFVRDHYAADAKSRSSGIRQKLQNKKDIAVLFPEPIALTESFCDCCVRLFTLAAENQVYREILSDMTTFENYFSTSSDAEPKA